MARPRQPLGLVSLFIGEGREHRGISLLAPATSIVNVGTSSSTEMMNNYAARLFAIKYPTRILSIESPPGNNNKNILIQSPRQPRRERCCAGCTVDMHRKVIHGDCTLQVTALTAATAGAAELVLDTRSLLIHSIQLLQNADGTPITPADVSRDDSCPKQEESENGTDLNWKLSESDPILGQALHVYCPALREAGSKVAIGVKFELTEASSAVQFLDPSLTASQNHPFLFTQCQAIHARALCPCQVCFSCVRTLRVQHGFWIFFCSLICSLNRSWHCQGNRTIAG